mmetsp:Transcript_10739/g.31965  ORF Transcript_10739/g.31965 Transcript_10739/m.31965 type:complete len:309 (-) Transcript_10739:878-1804(-)
MSKASRRWVHAAAAAGSGRRGTPSSRPCAAARLAPTHTSAMMRRCSSATATRWNRTTTAAPRARGRNRPRGRAAAAAVQAANAAAAAAAAWARCSGRRWTPRGATRRGRRPASASCCRKRETTPTGGRPRSHAKLRSGCSISTRWSSATGRAPTPAAARAARSAAPPRQQWGRSRTSGTAPGLCSTHTAVSAAVAVVAAAAAGREWPGLAPVPPHSAPTRSRRAPPPPLRCRAPATAAGSRPWRRCCGCIALTSVTAKAAAADWDRCLGSSRRHCSAVVLTATCPVRVPRSVDGRPVGRLCSRRAWAA